MIAGTTRIAGVMGWPVAHSLSPRLHGYWLRHYGIDGAYVPLAVRPEDFPQAIRALVWLGFRGANVTLPHKETAYRLVDRADPLAERIGAVNTIIVAEDGTLEGRNTDAFGFLAGLRQQVPGWRAEAGPAVILGAGGGARGCLVALLDAGVPEVRLVNRSLTRVERLAAEYGAAVSVIPWTERGQALSEAALLVNATTLGMTGQPALDLDLQHLPPTAAVTDIVYAPLETQLLAAARARGNPVADGLGMLLHQGRPGFEAWFGVDPQVTDEMRRFVLAKDPA